MKHMKTVKLSSSMLQHLITEEISRVKRGPLNEAPHRRAGRAGQAVYKLDSFSLLQFAKAYAKLGGAVQTQLDAVIEGDNNGDLEMKVNPNAVDMIEEHLGGMNEEIDAALASYAEYVMQDDGYGLGPGEADEDGYYKNGTKNK